MRTLIFSSMIVAATFASIASANAASGSGPMHSAHVMVGMASGPHGAYYKVRMNGKTYAMMPEVDYLAMWRDEREKMQPK